MSILIINFDGASVTPMRPESPVKTFSSDDVPSGTDSVYVKAARLLQHSAGKTLTVAIPQFTQSEIDSKIATKKAAITAVDTLTDESLPILEQTEVLNPTGVEIQARIDTERGFTESKAQQMLDLYNHTPTGTDENGEPAFVDPQRTLDEQKDLLRKRDNGAIVPDLTVQEATDAIIDERKQALAELQVKMIIDQCLEVPELSQDFKDQFTTYESE